MIGWLKFQFCRLFGHREQTGLWGAAAGRHGSYWTRMIVCPRCEGYRIERTYGLKRPPLDVT